MNKFSTDILNISGGAALVAVHGKITYATSAAEELLGQSCVGKKLDAVLCYELSELQASSFAFSSVIGDTPCIIRVTRFEEELVAFIAPSSMPESVLNSPFLCAARNSLMETEVSSSLMRDRAEALHDPVFLRGISCLSQSYCRLIRLINNASFIVDKSRELSPALLQNVDISELYGSLISSLRHYYINPELCGELGSGIVIGSEPQILIQLLLNLISNCLIHAGDCSRVTVRLSEYKDKVLISVSDNGSGIEPQELHKVFQRYSYSFGLSSMGRGAGLGLSVVRKIAELHGGNLLLESRPGHGTHVQVALTKKSCPSPGFRSVSSEMLSAKDILIGLSDCLRAECYSEKFMD